MFGLISKKRVINAFAKDLAYKQKKADKLYYLNNNQTRSSWMLDGVYHMQELMKNLGITKEVYNQAYKIYDFRNSGKKDHKPNLDELTKMN